MNRINTLLFEKYITQVVGEARGRGLEALFDPMPAPELIKFGRYRIVNNKSVVKVKFQEALDKKYISSVTAQNLNEFTKIGFKFDTAYFVDEYGYGASNSISTLVSGKDPEGKSMVYLRKAGSQSGPKIYYETEYDNAHVYFKKFSANAPVTMEDILNGVVSGKKWAVRNDGSGIIDTKGDVTLNNKVGIRGFDVYPLEDIPVKFGAVRGNLYLGLENITTASNLPREVYGNIFIDSDNMKSLVGGVETVHGRNISIGTPNLLTLEGFPKLTDIDSIITLTSMSSLTSLEGLPEVVSNFYLNGANVLTSLKGAPLKIKKGINLDNIPLIKNLMYFPETESSTSISIGSCDGLNNLKGMSNIAGSVNLVNLNNLVSIVDLPAHINDVLTLNGLPKLVSLHGLADKKINKISIRHMPFLRSLHGLPKDLNRLEFYGEGSNIGIENLIGCPEGLKELFIQGLSNLKSLEGLPFNVETVEIRSNLFTTTHSEEPNENDLKIIFNLLSGITEIGPNLQEIKYGRIHSYSNSVNRDFILKHTVEYNNALNKDNPGIEMDI
jgi:hypothetical protein